jgi:acyl transferase domain-containing protein
VLEIDGENKEYPRIAGVSSFGAGGSNAHIIIEEYIEKDQGNAQIKYDSKNPAIIVLSAKSEGQLEILAERLLEGIEGGLFTQEDFAGLAYTLQTGREAMEERLVFSAGSVKELGERLRDFKEGRNSEMLYRGKVKENRVCLKL